MVKTIARFTLMIAFLLAGYLFFLERKDDFLALDWPSTPAVAAVSLAFIINICITAVFNSITARRLGAPLGYTESFMLSSVTSAANFLLPLRAGAAFRSIYMKKVYRFQFSHFASALTVYYLATILVASFLGMICLVFIYLDQGHFRLDIFAALPAVFTIACFILLARKGTQTGNTTEKESWRTSFIDGYRQILANNRFVYIALSLVTAGLVVSTLGWSVALRDYAPQVSLGESLLIVTSQIIGGLVTLTPGGTGFQELAGLYVGKRFQMSMVELFAVLVWTKVVRIILSVVFALPSLVYLQRRIRGASRL